MGPFMTRVRRATSPGQGDVVDDRRSKFLVRGSGAWGDWALAVSPTEITVFRKNGAAPILCLCMTRHSLTPILRALG